MRSRDDADALLRAAEEEPALSRRVELVHAFLRDAPAEPRDDDGERVVRLLTAPPGTAGRRDALLLLGAVPGDAAAAALRAIETDASDPDRPTAMLALVLREERGEAGALEAFDLWRDRGDGPLERLSSRRSARPPERPEPAHAEPPPPPPQQGRSAPPPDVEPTPSPPGVEGRDGGRPSPRDPGGVALVPSPPVVHPRLDAPPEVAPGDELTVTVGLRPEADPELVSAGALNVPGGELTLDVFLSFDPAAFALLGGDAGPWRLHRTADDPWPALGVGLIARRADGLKPERRVDAKFLRSGELVGFASRAVTVREPRPAPRLAASVRAGAPSPPGPAPQTHGRLRLSGLHGMDAPDLTVYIRYADDVAGRRLVFTADSRHAHVADSVAPLAESLGDADLGETPEQLGADARFKVMTTTDPEDLYRWLHGFGVRVGRVLPAPVRAAIRQAVAGGTAERPASILVLSEEPYVPWELAVSGAGWGFPGAGTSPFLGAHAAVGRWVLADVPPPPVRPRSAVHVAGAAVVAARYEGIVGWSRLEHAEAEAGRLAAVLGPATAVVPPHLADVLGLLDGRPEAQVLHFALHGTFDPAGPERGLVLVGERGGRPAAQLLQPEHVLSARLRREPFVYLNACQVAAGDGRVLGDYGGLAWAFLAAGAGAVVAPLWNVADETASAMAVELYETATSPGPASDPDPVSVGEVLRRLRARYTLEAVREGRPGVDAALVSFQLFGHPRLRLRRLPTREATMTADPTDG
jgi:hypothetical protein